MYSQKGLLNSSLVGRKTGVSVTYVDMLLIDGQSMVSRWFKRHGRLATVGSTTYVHTPLYSCLQVADGAAVLV
jgi:hypothetical protein